MIIRQKLKFVIFVKVLMKMTSGIMKMTSGIIKQKQKKDNIFGLLRGGVIIRQDR
jgi:hypothetical protein